MRHFNAKQLRHGPVNAEIKKQIKRSPIVFVLDNIVDTYNIGAFFRLADAIAVEKVYLAGEMVAPPNLKIHRASVGTWRWVPWEQRRQTKPLLRELKKQGYQLAAVEQTKSSRQYWQVKPHFPVALILGNESRGLEQEVIDLADICVELPMAGINQSLNVYAAAAVVAYHFYHQLATVRQPIGI